MPSPDGSAGPVDRGEVVAGLAPAWVDGLPDREREEASRLVHELVDGWVDEAGRSRHPERVVQIHVDDLEDAGRGKDARARLDVLRLRDLRRRLEHLGGQTYSLGRDIVDGAVESSDAAARGRALLERAEALAEEVEALPDDPGGACSRLVKEAMVEALGATEGGATSLRLQRYAASRAPDGDDEPGAAGDPGPPTILP